MQRNIDIGDFRQCQHKACLAARFFLALISLTITILSRRSENMKGFETSIQRVIAVVSRSNGSISGFITGQ